MACRRARGRRLLTSGGGGEPPPPPHPLKWRSGGMTGDPLKAPHEEGSWLKMACARSNLLAAGWDEAAGDFDKPIITIGVPWSNALPCNNHLRELADLLVAEVGRSARARARASERGAARGRRARDGGTRERTVVRHHVSIKHLLRGCVETSACAAGREDKDGLAGVGRLSSFSLLRRGGPREGAGVRSARTLTPTTHAAASRASAVGSCRRVRSRRRAARPSYAARP